MRGLDYKWIAALDAVLQYGSFERAAEKLCISQSAVSQRIKQLEKFIAQPALVRCSPPKPTLIGKKLLGLYRRVLLLEQETMPELLNDTLARPVTLSIATNADSLASWVIPALEPIMKKENVAFHFSILDESRSIEKMKNGEVVGAISLEKHALAGCRAEYLGKMDYLCVASPSFIARYFTEGVNADSLLNAPSVAFDMQDTQHKEFLKQHFAIDGELRINHKVGSSEAFVALACAGLAYCLIPRLQIEQELASGQLVDITPGLSITNRMYWHHWLLEMGILAQLSADIVHYARAHLPQ